MGRSGAGGDVHGGIVFEIGEEILEDGGRPLGEIGDGIGRAAIITGYHAGRDGFEELRDEFELAVGFDDRFRCCGDIWDDHILDISAANCAAHVGDVALVGGAVGHAEEEVSSSR